MKKTPGKLFTVLLIGVLLLGCEKDEDATGLIDFRFNHLIDNQVISFNEMIYENAAGNPYEVKEIQWFISDVALVSSTGREVVLNKGGFSHYVDTNLPTTLAWSPPDKIPAGNYTHLIFTFGIKGEKNTPGIFPNLPESAMVWPMALGGENGGYHYMKLNGFWRNNENVRTPFNFHIGVGQLYNENQEVTAFVQNWFELRLPIELAVKANALNHIHINMLVNKWFDDPYIYDFNVMGGKTMTNQDAMQKIKGNGAHAFSAVISNY